jgi:purine-nucleoside phosphorylase
VTTYSEAAAEAAAVLADKTGVEHHDIALVMGSGWLPAVDALGEAVAEISTTDLPGFAPPAVAGHSGKIRSVRSGEKNLLVFLGRTHYYEGLGVRAVVHGVRTAAAAGCRTVVLTNGCGGLRPTWTPGTPVLISDHINLTATSPIEGANFVDLTDLYSPRLRALCQEIEPGLEEGVYVQFPGPHYETPAEIRMVRALGGERCSRSGHGGTRHLAGHQPRRRHDRRTAQPCRGAGGRKRRGIPDGPAARIHRSADLSRTRRASGRLSQDGVADEVAEVAEVAVSVGHASPEGTRHDLIQGGLDFERARRRRLVG